MAKQTGEKIRTRPNRDSTKTRVAPVFDALRGQDKTGEKWLAGLLTLPQLGKPIDPSQVSGMGALEEACWDASSRKRREKKLAPPISLLSWLVRHLREAHPQDITGDADKARRRRKLQEGDPATVAKALDRLRSSPGSRGWHVLEGRSSPDVYLTTPRAVVVIEGKRTEAKPTTHTSFMKGRHQMLRHMDAAYEIAGNRAVLGFFIVEGGEAGEVPPVWRDAAEQTLSPEAIDGSLPHRPQAERDAIVGGFLGVTTWEQVCTRFGIDPQVMIDEI